MAGLERFQPAHRGDDGFLNEIAGVVQTARGWGEPSVSPAAEWRDAAFEQAIERRTVANLDELEEIDRGL
jgi:hypothetical protein